MGVDYATLYGFLRNLGCALEFNYTCVAAGGTSLTLYGIKSSTEDVDFVVEHGDVHRIRSVAQSIGGPRTDFFEAGTVFNNQLPSDYLSRAKHVGVFGKLSVMAMNPLDVVMTKIARAGSKDIEDIRLCASHGCTVEHTLGSVSTHYINTPELRNNMYDVLYEVYGIKHDTREMDMR